MIIRRKFIAFINGMGYFPVIGIVVILAVVTINLYAWGSEKTSEKHSLSRDIKILEDREGHSSVEEVVFGPQSRWRRPENGDALNFGLSASAFWFRFRITQGISSNDEGGFITLGPGDWWLDIGAAMPERMNSAVYLAGGPTEPLIQLDPNRLRLYKIPLLPTVIQEYYVRVDSDTALAMAPRMIKLESYVKSQSNRFILLGLYYGMIIAVIIYNLFAYFSLDDKSYLWFALHLFFLVLSFAGINGLIENYVLVGNPDLSGTVCRTFIGFVYFFGGLFTRSFLITWRNAPKFDRLILIYITVALLLAVFNPVSPPRFINAAMVLESLFAPVITILAGLLLFNRGFKPARFFVLAWTVFILGVLMMALTFGGMLPYSLFTLYASQIGSAVSAVLFTVAFGDRVKTLRLEKETLRKKESRIRIIMDSIKSGILLIDPRTRLIVEANPEAARIIGAPQESIVGNVHLDDIFPNGNQSITEDEDQLLLQGVEMEVTTLSGQRVPVIKSSKSVILEDIPFTLESLIDITERKLLEEERERLISDLQTALAEVKTLQGFIPICAHCHKIRDDAGYWQQIEKYLQARTDAQFSHGICPDCLRKLYPDRAERIIRRLKEKGYNDTENDKNNKA